jgi:hypothetical protein
LALSRTAGFKRLLLQEPLLPLLVRSGVEFLYSFWRCAFGQVRHVRRIRVAADVLVLLLLVEVRAAHAFQHARNPAVRPVLASRDRITPRTISDSRLRNLRHRVLLVRLRDLGDHGGLSILLLGRKLRLQPFDDFSTEGHQYTFP